MEPVLKYYCYHEMPNEEELKACIDIATKSKSTVMLYFNDTDRTVSHLFVHPKEELEDIKQRLLKITSLTILD